MEENDKVLEALENFLVKRIEQFNENTSAEQIQVVADLVRVATVRKEVNRKTILIGR